MALRPRLGIELFAGAGMLGVAVELAFPGARPVCYVEREAYAAAALVARMEEKALAPAPVWSDVASFDGRPWRGVVDYVSGGFPCQDISGAGRGEGIRRGNRSGLWFEFARIIGEVGPRFVFVENVAILALRGLDVVLGTLADLGFDAEWLTLPAAAVGASHERDRLFLLAHARGAGLPDGEFRGLPGPAGSGPGEERPAASELRRPQMADANGRGCGIVGRPSGGVRCRDHSHGRGRSTLDLFALGPDDPRWTDVLRDFPELAPAIEPGFRGVVDGMAGPLDEGRADQLRLTGNGVVAIQGAIAYRLLARRFGG